MNAKAGILGGAFNPPHIAHLELAEKAMKAFGLEQVIFMPTRIAPHKTIEGGWDGTFRWLLTSIATFAIKPDQLKAELQTLFPGDPSARDFLVEYEWAYPGKHRPEFMVSDLEIKTERVSYTIDTVKDLSVLYPDWLFYIIIGMDQAQSLDTWKDWQLIAKTARFAVANRNGINFKAVKQKFPFIEPFAFSEMDISSTMIRSRLSKGESLSGLVPPMLEKFFKISGINYNQ